MLAFFGDKVNTLSGFPTSSFCPEILSEWYYVFVIVFLTILLTAVHMSVQLYDLITINSLLINIS